MELFELKDYGKIRGGKRGMVMINISGYYKFRGESEPRAAELIGVPSKNTIFYIGMDGRVALTGDADWCASSKPDTYD